MRDRNDNPTDEEDSEERCPNCSSPIAWEDVCAECGHALDEDGDEAEGALEDDLDVDEDDDDYDLDEIERDGYEIDGIDEVDGDSYDEDDDEEEEEF